MLQRLVKITDYKMKTL